MRAIAAPLAALLATSKYVSADLWTITLNAGSVVRWTSADVPISFGGFTWIKGPTIRRGQISEKRGVEVAALDVEITALTGVDTIRGNAIIPYIAAHGFDGATVKLERAFAPNWLAPIAGTVIRFAGKVTSIGSIQGATAKLTVSSWMILLDAALPRNLYQAGCIHTLYDSGCTINPALFSVNSTVSAGGQTTNLATALVAPSVNDYALGRIVFTSGGNNGLSRTVRSNDAAGNVVLVSPLPVAAGAGDTFTIFKGCDLIQPTCTTKFNNLPNFKATPFVPLPTAAMGGVASTTTKSGK